MKRSKDTAEAIALAWQAVHPLPPTPEQVLLDERRQPCTNCNSTGKAQDTFDKMCDKCTPVHCCRCGVMVGLTQVGSYSLCRSHLAEEREES